MIPAFNKYLYIFSFLIAGFVVGIFIEKVLLRLLEKYFRKTTLKTGNVIVSSFKGLFLGLCVTFAFILAVHYFPPTPIFQSYAKRITLASIILLFSILAGRLSARLIAHQTRDMPGKLTSTSIILNITRITILLIGAMLVLQVFGVSVTPLLTALGVGGLAVALALQETLSNLFAGIQLIASKKIRNGDYIKLSSGEEGFILDITWRNTVIRALANNLVIVPNAKLSSAIITNYNLPDKELAVLVEMSVASEADLDEVEKLSVSAATETLKIVKGGVATFEPFIRYHSISSAGINFSVILRGMEFEDQFLIKHEFIKTLFKKYKAAHIEIPFSIKTIFVKNGNNTADTELTLTKQKK